MSGSHGRLVPNPVVLVRQQEPENATILILLMEDPTVLVTPCRPKIAIPTHVQVRMHYDKGLCRIFLRSIITNS